MYTGRNAPVLVGPPRRWPPICHNNDTTTTTTTTNNNNNNNNNDNDKDIQDLAAGQAGQQPGRVARGQARCNVQQVQYTTICNSAIYNSAMYNRCNIQQMQYTTVQYTTV